MGVLVLAQVVDGRVQKALRSHESGDDILDDQLGWVSEGSLGPSHIQAEAHAISSLHGLNDIKAGERTRAQLVNEGLVVLPELFKVKVLDDSLHLALQLLVELFILDGSLVELLLEALLGSDGPVSQVIEESNLGVVGSPSGRSQDLHDLDSLSLAILNLLKYFLPEVLVLDLDGHLGIAIDLLVESLDILKPLFSTHGLVLLL
mmetsp:Transcript_23476/g.23135  ORF Transcript_23476/g.23135 Transcript_23476/m.23135 type:complete len:204 (+) Transcript_23476:1139-1750(+)